MQNKIISYSYYYDLYSPRIIGLVHIDANCRQDGRIDTFTAHLDRFHTNISPFVLWHNDDMS